MGFVISILLIAVVSISTVPSTEESKAVVLAEIAVTYLIGGLTGGAVAGAFATWAQQSWLRAGAVGILTFLPVVSVISFVESGRFDWQAALVVAAVLGFPLGIIGRKVIMEIDPFGPI